MKRVLSGIQPTGTLHLGNYLGAMKNWIEMQKQYECLFCIVDLHAITVPYNPIELRAHARKTAATYIACGINPEESSVFIQSTVRAHTELGWILGCQTPLGWLNRMTQFKDKAGKHKESASLGLYAYPVLMAADILIYKATHVPVGDDQKQHIELCRDIAGAFNRTHDTPYFPLPEPIIPKMSARIMSLRDGTSKMSKSDPSDFSRINLTDSNEEIDQKIRKAKTDPDPIPGSVEGLETRPEARNLLGIYAALSHQTMEQTLAEFEDAPFSAFKPKLAEILISTLSPIRDELERLVEDRTYMDQLLAMGSEKANELAERHMKEIRALTGF